MILRKSFSKPILSRDRLYFQRVQYRFIHSTTPNQISWDDWGGVLKKFSGENDDEDKKNPFKNKGKDKEQKPESFDVQKSEPSQELPNDWSAIGAQTEKLDKKWKEAKGQLGEFSFSKVHPISEALEKITESPFDESKRLYNQKIKERTISNLVGQARRQHETRFVSGFDVMTDNELNPSLIQEITYPEIEEPFGLEDPVFLTPYHDVHPEEYPEVAAWNPWEYNNLKIAQNEMDVPESIYDEDYEDIPLPKSWVALISSLPFYAMRPHQPRPYKPYVRDELEQKIYDRIRSTFPLAQRRAFLEASILLDVRRWPDPETPGFDISIVSPSFRDKTKNQSQAMIMEAIKDLVEEDQILQIRAYPPYYDTLKDYDVTPQGWSSILDNVEKWDTIDHKHTINYKIGKIAHSIRGLPSESLLPVSGSRTINRSRKSLEELPSTLYTAFSLSPEEKETLYDGVEPPELTEEIKREHQKKKEYLETKDEIEKHIIRQRKLDEKRIRKEEKIKKKSLKDNPQSERQNNEQDYQIFDSGKRFSWLSDQELSRYQKILSENPFKEEEERYYKTVKERKKDRLNEEEQIKKNIEAKIEGLKKQLTL